jgi:hypothetical protein
VQHPPGGKAGGEERHHGAAEAELGRHGARVQPGGAAEGEQRVVARVHAAPHRRHPHAVGHARVDQGVDAAAQSTVSMPRRSASAETARSAAARSSVLRPPRKLPGSRKPSTRLASVTVGSVPPAP